MPGRLGKEPKESSGRRGRRSNGEGQGGKARRKRNDVAKVNHLSVSSPFLHKKNVFGWKCLHLNRLVLCLSCIWCGKIKSILLAPLYHLYSWLYPCRPWCWMQMELACPPAQNHISVSTVMLPSAALTTCADMCSYTQVRDFHCLSALYFFLILPVFSLKV